MIPYNNISDFFKKLYKAKHGEIVEFDYTIPGHKIYGKRKVYHWERDSNPLTNRQSGADIFYKLTDTPFSTEEQFFTSAALKDPDSKETKECVTRVFNWFLKDKVFWGKDKESIIL